MDFLAIILSLIWLLLILRGLHQGILRMLCGVISCILVYAIIIKMNPLVTEYLKEQPAVVSWTQSTAEKYIETKEKEYKRNNDDEDGELLDIHIPIFMRESMLDELDSVKNDVRTAAEESRAKVKNSLVAMIADLIIKGIATVVIILGAMIIFLLTRVLINIVGSIPIIHGTSKLMGGFLGAVEGLMLIWLFLFLVQCFSATHAGMKLMAEADSSAFLQAINEYNPLPIIFRK